MPIRRRFDELYVKDADGDFLLVYGSFGTPSDGDVEIWNDANQRKEWGAGGGGALSDGDYGDIVVSSTGTVLTIDTNVVTDAKLRQGTACTVIGRSANSTGNVADIALNADGKFLVRRSGVVQGDTLVAGDIPNLAASIITSGTLALARGGTNADLSASGGTTQVLAQDASHVISARALVAADIPNLDASKITAGTLPEARGGTNQSTYTTGDILYASAANTLSKLPIGGTNKVLTVVAGIPAWVDVTGSGGGGVLPPWVAYSPDTTPASANTEDDEFDSSSLAGKWTETITGSPTINYDTTVRSHYMMKSTATSNQNVIVSQSFSATAFSIAARMRSPSSVSAAIARLFISDGTALTNAFIIQWNGAGTVSVVKRVAGTPTTLVTSSGFSSGYEEVILYLQKMSANTWRFAVSLGGRAWSSIGPTTTTTVTFTETTIGFTLNNGAGYVGDRFCCDWFRRDWITIY